MQKFDPYVIRTRNLSIWSRMRYRCAKESWEDATLFAIYNVICCRAKCASVLFLDIKKIKKFLKYTKKWKFLQLQLFQLQLKIAFDILCLESKQQMIAEQLVIFLKHANVTH